jgi:hypothetical protein
MQHRECTPMIIRITLLTTEEVKNKPAQLSGAQ